MLSTYRRTRHQVSPQSIRIGKIKGNKELHPKKGIQKVNVKKKIARLKKPTWNRADNLKEWQAVTRKNMTTNKISKQDYTSKFGTSATRLLWPMMHSLVVSLHVWWLSHKDGFIQFIGGTDQSNDLFLFNRVHHPFETFIFVKLAS